MKKQIHITLMQSVGFYDEGDNSMEKTLVLIKPDGVERNLIGEILCFYERKGLKITSLKMVKADRETAEDHYIEHKGRSYFEGLINFITSGPLCALVVEGENAVQAVRQINGSTEPLQAAMGSIRGTYALSMGRNMVHGSDSVEHAEREIKVWFKE